MRLNEVVLTQVPEPKAGGATTANHEAPVTKGYVPPPPAHSSFAFQPPELEPIPSYTATETLDLVLPTSAI